MKKKLHIGILATSLILLIFFSCNKSEDRIQTKSQKIEYTGETNSDNPIPNEEIPPKDQTKIKEQNTISKDELKKIGKKIIKTADISIKVNNYNKEIKKIKETIKKFQAYISSEDEENYESTISNTIIIRVKYDQFDSLLNAILSGKRQIISKQIKIKDITKEYIDVYQRLKNKKLVEKQYETLLKKANTIDEILKVRHYLSTIQEDIESAEGQLKYMENQTNYSTITLHIKENTNKKIKNSIWQQIKQGLQFGWQLMIYVFLAIFYIWPVWILLVIIIFAVKRQKNKKSKTSKND